MKRTKEKVSKGKKIAIGLAALVLLAIAGYFAFAYTTDYLRYRAIESYDRQLDDMASELGAEVIRREKYCYDDVIKLSHNLLCYNALIVNENAIRDYEALVNELRLNRGKGIFCNKESGPHEATVRIQCGSKMREWMPYEVYEDIADLYW